MSDKQNSTSESGPAFLLYVMGDHSAGKSAASNLKKICEDVLAGKYSLEIVDIAKEPRLANENKILAVPTLIRLHPKPPLRIIGDLSETDRVKSLIVCDLNTK